MSTDKTIVHVTVSRNFSRFVSKDWLMTIGKKVLQSAGIDIPAEVGLVITGDRTIRRLNRQYRGKDESTDVLSFPMSGVEDSEGVHFVSPPDGVCHLGEVIICYPQVVRQCEIHGHSITDELEVLIVHGILHLLGYDHETPRERARMRRKEKEILTKLRHF